MVRIFKYDHTLKENKERFAYQRSYTLRLEAVTQQSQHIKDDSNNIVVSVVDSDMVCRNTASEPYKNHDYGLRSFFTDNLCTSTLRPSSPSATSRPVNPEDGINLREQVLELTWSLHQQAQQLQQSESGNPHMCVRHRFPQAGMEAGAGTASVVFQDQMRANGNNTAGGSGTARGAPTSHLVHCLNSTRRMTTSTIRIFSD
ncbi:hypothetical protein Ahy_A01g002647 isoform B [Arachis hypogaea]|uniref:Uncharacterized protein n=1 Tax=Arachis hypogaea TaxID=3818 RepID=A0A445ERG1_ARAHY|nr:hypothetical protein Ahy_A01g002647 isoform B [Arachis hypogaea]